MPESGARLEVGRIAKAHGLKGEVVVAPVSNRPERFAVDAVLFIGDEPHRILASRLHQNRYLVRLDGIDDRTSAERVRGSVLTGEPLGDAPEGEVWVHELVDAQVRHRDGRELGRIVAVEANPAHDMLVLDGGALIPIVFVVDQQPGVVTIDPPDGLLELFE